MIKNNKVFFRTYDAFQSALQSGQISGDSIVFIKDKGLIWTHGAFFGGIETIKHIIISESRYDALESYDDNAIYFLTEDTEWGFGDNFPIILTEYWAFDGTFPITLS